MTTTFEVRNPRSEGNSKPGIRNHLLVKDAATAKHFAPLVDSAGQWRTRDDVWISHLDRNVPLTVGYGARHETIGPELGFGWHQGWNDRINDKFNAETYYLIGEAMGEAMKRLLDAQ